MLIRSQDKEVITNMAATNQIYVREIYRQNGSLFDISTDEMRLGYYSTKNKSYQGTGHDSGSLCKWTYWL